MVRLLSSDIAFRRLKLGELRRLGVLRVAAGSAYSLVIARRTLCPCQWDTHGISTVYVQTSEGLQAQRLVEKLDDLLLEGRYSEFPGSLGLIAIPW